MNGASARVRPDGGFAGRVSLVEGENRIELAGERVEPRTIRVIADATPPTLEIAAPLPGFVTKEGEVTVRGRASDDRKLATVVIDETVARLADDGSFSQRVLLASEGDNVIRVVAKDAAGNETAREVTVRRDTRAPAIEIAAFPAERPADGRLRVGGSVDKDGCTVTVNGAAAEMSGRRFSASVPVKEGANAIVVTATDAAGNTGPARRTYTMTPAAEDASPAWPGAEWRAPEPLVAGMRRGKQKGVYVWEKATDGTRIDIEMVHVPAGEFLMGDDKHRQTIASAYSIARNEVTVAQFDAFVQAKGYKTEAEKEGWAYAWAGRNLLVVQGASWRKPGFPQGRDHPVVCVSANDADAWCTWAGLRLPSEEEWEKAARGTSGNVYPWGNDWDGSKCNHGTFAWCDESDGYKHTSPVGAFPQGASPYGALDMAGNVWEWTRAVDGSDRVVRGGSWYGDAGGCRAADRGRGGPSNRVASLGFRPARVITE